MIVFSRGTSGSVEGVPINHRADIFGLFYIHELLISK